MNIQYANHYLEMPLPMKVMLCLQCSMDVSSLGTLGNTMVEDRRGGIRVRTYGVMIVPIYKY